MQNNKILADQAHGSPNYEIIKLQASRLGTTPVYITGNHKCNLKHFKAINYQMPQQSTLL